MNISKSGPVKFNSNNTSIKLMQLKYVKVQYVTKDGMGSECTQTRVVGRVIDKIHLRTLSKKVVFSFFST